MIHFSKKSIWGIRFYLFLNSVVLFSFCTVYDENELTASGDTADTSVDDDSSTSSFDDTGTQPFIDGSIVDAGRDIHQINEASSVGESGDSDADLDAEDPPDVDSGSEDDECPDDPDKTEMGVCGCGSPDSDQDSDGVLDCEDKCKYDPDKTAPGVCGCHTPDVDDDSDGVENCLEECIDDPDKTDPGACGCGVPDTDTDSDGLLDCDDPAPYGWQRRITLDGSQVDATLTDFRLLVRLTDDHLQSEAAPDGNDIHFRDEDQTSLLDFEIESYDPDDGALVAWVRLPTLDTRDDTILYLAYGDGEGDRSNPGGVWDGYHYVWHMSQDPEMGADSIKDAAQHAHGTPHGSMTSANRIAAVAGYGISFDGVDDEISFTNDFTGGGASTISAWVYQSLDSSAYGSAVISFGNESTNEARFLLSLDNNTSDRIRFGFYSNDITGVELSTDVWSYVVWTWDGSNSSLYINESRVTGPTVHTGADTAGEDGVIGNTTFGYERFLSGRLDEVRVATSARSNAWILAEYRNQNPDSDFVKDIDTEQPIENP